MKKAFTLTEVIIVLAILGVLALILIPNMMNMIPDDHNARYKKAFYTTQEIVNDIVSDPVVCPNVDAAGNTFDDDPLNNCSDNLSELFCERLNTTTNVNCGALAAYSEIQTTNGMRWWIDTQDLSNAPGTLWQSTIFVDVDGGNEAFGRARNPNAGIYMITVRQDGKVFAGNINNAGDDEDNLLLNSPTN